MDQKSPRERGLTSDEAGAFEAAYQAALNYRLSLPERPARPVIGPDEAERRFRTALPEEGVAARTVIEEIVREAEDGLHQMTAPTFFGYVIGASHPVGVAADFLVSTWGQNAATALETPSTAGMERAVCDWIIDLLDLPRESGAGIVTGGTVANMVGIMAGRHALLAAQGWDVEKKGLFGAPAFPVLIGQEAHSAPFASLRYAGIGADHATRVAADSEGRIRVEAFRAALAVCTAPPLVILQAGHINTGAFDPFEALIPLVRERGGWVHVDGAIGQWLAAVPELARRVAGLSAADSWAIDLHKWLNAPYDAGMAIVRDRAALVASMSARGAYLPGVTDHWEPTDSVPELSRRARGVPSYAILRHLGRSGVREMVARHCRLAERVARTLAAEPGIEVLNEIHSNQVAIVCGSGVTGDEQTMRVLDRVHERAKVYPSHGVWAGRKIIRVSVIGYAVREKDVDLVCSEIIDAWRWCQANPA